MVELLDPGRVVREGHGHVLVEEVLPGEGVVAGPGQLVLLLRQHLEAAQPLDVDVVVLLDHVVQAAPGHQLVRGVPGAAVQYLLILVLQKGPSEGS